MRVCIGTLITATMLGISGCSTIAENPNYQQATKYKGSNPYTGAAVIQQAKYQTQTQTQTQTQAQIQTQAPAPITYAPQQAAHSVPQATNYAAPPVAAPATTGIQENTASLGEGGTPGYYAVNGINPPTQSAPETQPQYTQIQPVQPLQIQPEPVPVSVPMTFAAISAPTGTVRHTVVSGDTLYSLARTSCSSVSEIQLLNTIDDKFYIRAGEDILVPSQRCVD